MGFLLCERGKFRYETYQISVLGHQISVSNFGVNSGQILSVFEKSYLLIRKEPRVVPPGVSKVIESSFI